MTTPDPTTTTKTRSAWPGTRRYVVWRFAMWIIVVYAFLAGGGMTLVTIEQLKGRWDMSPWQGSGYSMPAVHIQLAYWVAISPITFLLVPLLSPLAIAGCYRASMAKRSRPLLLIFLSVVLLISVLLAGAILALESSGPVVTVVGSLRIATNLAASVLSRLEKLAIILFPLPVILLASLMTIGCKKPAALEKRHLQ